MQIFVKNLDGQTQVVEISEQQTAFDCKTLISNQTGVDCSLINLVCEGSILSDSDFLTEKLEEQSTVYVTAGLDGGKKKKKKKPKTTPKKNKHMHKSEKLKTLTYYNVDSSGKVTHTRKQLVPGIFMAKHFDRHYCGLTHASLKLDPKTIEANKKEMEKKMAAKAKLKAENEDAAKGGKDSKKAGKDKKKKK